MSQGCNRAAWNPSHREAKDCMFEASLDNFMRLPQIQDRIGVVAHWWSVCLAAHSLPQDCGSRSAVTPLSLGGTPLASPLPRYQRGFLTTLSVLSGQPSEEEHDF